VDGRNGLLTLAVYLAATMLLVAVALFGVYEYSTHAHLTGLTPIEDEQAPELAVRYRDRAKQTSEQRERAADMEKQRIRLLEAMLDEKTQRLRQLSGKLEEKTTQYEDLRARYDEAVVLAVETLGQDPNVAGSDAKRPATGDSKKADPALLEAELSVAREVHDSLVSDVTTLQEELSRAQQELAQLKDARDQETMERLREAMVLENAAASVLLRVGRQAVPALRDALNHASPAVRRWAATVLGGMGSEAEDAVSALTEALSDTDPDVRAAVQSALESIER